MLYLQEQSRKNEFTGQDINHAAWIGVPSQGRNPGDLQSEAEEKSMPTYEFRCKNCARKVILVISFKDYEKKGQKCPKCGSKRLERLISTVQVQTSRKS